MRLKANEVKQYRLDLLKKQGYYCALCNQALDPAEAVLDHNHTTGAVRGVLHRGCNALEGKIANSLKINKITHLRLQNILKNLIQYQQEDQGVLHHTHRTLEEKKLAAKKRAKKKRAIK